MIDPQPFLHGYDFPKTKTQFHFHGRDENNLTYGKLKDYKGKTLFEEKDSHNLAINDYIFERANFKRFP